VAQLDEVAAYTLAWLPAPFLPRPVGEAALDRLAAALVSKGNLVVGLYAGLYAAPTDKAGAALTALRVVRSGGHVWDIAEIEQQLRARGFVEVETCVIPRRPASASCPAAVLPSATPHIGGLEGIGLRLHLED
jgi:hypothetical protein